MSSILFTDADGTWRLHNGKPWPASRFQSWTPDSMPFGDAAARQSDGALTMFRLRTDYSVSFEMKNIPSVPSSNLVLQPENFGTTWSAVGSPTRSAGAHQRNVSLDLLGDDSAAAVEGYSQPIVFAGNAVKAISLFVRVASSSFVLLQLNDASAAVTRLLVLIQPAIGSAPSVTASTGTYLGAEHHYDSVYRLGFASTAVIAANTNNLILHPSNTIAGDVTLTGQVYAGGVQAEDASLPTPYLYTTTAARSNVSMVEIADRLIYHLRNGGTCALYTNDAAGSNYVNCGLKPGTSPSLQLAERNVMEYTLSLQLLNVAGSPARMLARFAEQ